MCAEDLEAERAAEKKRREMAIKANSEISQAKFCNGPKLLLVCMRGPEGDTESECLPQADQGPDCFLGVNSRTM